MKARTINAVLTKKHNEWSNSITDERVRLLAKKNTVITGGSIVSMLLDEPVNDFDLYFTDKETIIAVAEYYAKQAAFLDDVEVRPNENGIKLFIKSSGVATTKDEIQDYALNPDEIIPEEENDDKPKYRPLFFSTNAITLSNKIQIILRFCGSPDEIHRNYDFVHCTNYWTSSDNKLTLKPKALEAILTRELIYQGSLYPICSVIRTRKFIKRGWSITAGQYLKMCLQISQLDLTDIETLEDQLIGVDTLYFIDIIRRLKEKGNTVDVCYLAEILDRMF